MEEEQAQHIFHHYDDAGPRVAVKVERNSRGHNWEATVTGAHTVHEAMTLLRTAETELRLTYGEAPA